MISIDKGGNKIITLPVFNILITITKDGSVGAIVTDLHENEENLGSLESKDEELYNASIDGIESMILAHAISGVDVTSEPYIEGIESAVTACANNF